MSEQHASITATVAAIESATAGRWGIWQSDTGWWWAARTDALSASDLSAGCVPFIHADNPEELIERIRQQDRMGTAPPSGTHGNPISGEASNCPEPAPAPVTPRDTEHDAL